MGVQQDAKGRQRPDQLGVAGVGCRCDVDQPERGAVVERAAAAAVAWSRGIEPSARYEAATVGRTLASRCLSD
jgi:hypothetical protein